MGRESKKVYIYNEKGEFINEYKSSTEFAKEYKLSKNVMSLISNVYDKDIYMVNEKTFASVKKVGKQRIKLFYKKYKSPYVRHKNPYKEEKIIDCYNLNGELIASFKDEFYLKALLGNRQINIAKDDFFYNTDLKFKYRDTKNNIEDLIDELKNKLIPTMGVLIELDKLKDKYSNL